MLDKTKFEATDICFLFKKQRSWAIWCVGSQNKAYHFNKYICFLNEMLRDICATALQNLICLMQKKGVLAMKNSFLWAWFFTQLSLV